MKTFDLSVFFFWFYKCPIKSFTYVIHTHLGGMLLADFLRSSGESGVLYSLEKPLEF